MGLWPFDQAPPANALLARVSQELVQEAVEMREHVLLSTPYLTFPARISGVGPDEVRLTSALSADAARRTLGDHPLSLKLPWRLSMVSGPVSFRRHVQEGRHRELVVSRPPWLVPDDRRRHIRCELVGKSTLTLTRDDLQQARGILDNLSMGGAGVFFPDPADARILMLGAQFEMSLRLDQGPADLRLRVRVVQGDFPRLGLAFVEPLPPPEAERLKEWLTPRLEEALRHWENRKAMRVQAEQAIRLQWMEAQAEGVLIVGSQLFGEEVSKVLEGLAPLRLGRPALASLKPLLARPPQLVVLQVAKGDLEERYRLRNLWQALDLGCPLILLGTGSPGSAQELCLELRAAGALQWDPARSRFFLRMAQGLIRRA
jgi:hypothetical protein